MLPFAGQKYCRMLPFAQDAPRGAFCNPLTFIKLPFVIKIFVLSIFVWPFYTGFTLCVMSYVCAINVHELPSCGDAGVLRFV